MSVSSPIWMRLSPQIHQIGAGTLVCGLHLVVVWSGAQTCDTLMTSSSEGGVRW